MAKARQQYFADEVTLQKENRDFAIQPELVEKLESIEAWAQVNVIETVKVNWEALVPDEDKAVDIDVPLVEDDLYWTDNDAALSARQGRVLYDYIQNIQSRWRFLSNWNCATWLAMTNPSDNPYLYRTWDYFLVSNVSSGTNYRPNWDQYVIWQASITVESETVRAWDMYIYDWTYWLLLINTEREIPIDSSLSTTSTNPVENRVITNALNTKQEKLIAWTNIQIAADWKTISATDTTYENKVAAEWGTDVSLVTTWDKYIWNNKQDKLIAGSNISIAADWKTISAVDTTYSNLPAAEGWTSVSLVSTWDKYIWNNKQDAIADLETIRSNASAWKNASDTIATYWDIVTHDVSEFATSAQWWLADTAIQPWDNISELTNDAWYVTPSYHDVTKQDALIAGANIQIASDWKTISATDTTYVANDFDIKDLADTTGLRTTWSWKQDALTAWANITIDANNEISSTDTTYTAWVNVSISNNNVISATDSKAEWWNISWTLSDQTDLNTALGWKQDTLIAWANIQIASDGKTISSTDTTYTAGTWISIDANNVISNTQTSAEWWNIIGTLSDQTDLQNALDAKQDDMVVLSYGTSTWNDFITAYNKNAVVYCKASSNSNPATWNQGRMAFMAFVTIDWGWTPTAVEFQYYRSITTHSDSQQWDQVFIYKLENTNWWKWTVTTREAYTKVEAWTNMTSSYSNWTITLNADWQVDDTAYASSWDWVISIAPSKNAVYDKISTMDTTISWKQDALTAGTNIQIDSNTNTISATDTTYTAWTNIQISAQNEISATDTTYTASDFDIKDLADTTGLRTTWSWKQDAINDLATIRTWAGKGATAVQPLDNVSTLTNDAGYITKAINDLTNYYTKSETYTKSEVADYVANFAWFKVVATLPTTDIKTTVIYLLWPVWSGQDKYEEYIYSNNAWVMIWETSVDLTNYFNTSTQTSDAITQWSTNLFLTSAERTKLWNTSWTNSGDETKTTIQTKLWAASASSDWYLTSTDWNTFNWKQNALSTQTAYTSKGSTTKVPQITTNTLWQVTWITEVTIEQPDISGKADKTEVLTKTNTTSFTPTWDYHPATKKYVDDNISAATQWAVSDEAYAASWNGVTGIAPSKNALYDKISAMDTTIWGKANDSDVVKLTWNQTINWTKTFGTSPIVPSKTSAVTNSWTAITTEAQVYNILPTVMTASEYWQVSNPVAGKIYFIKES